MAKKEIPIWCTSLQLLHDSWTIWDPTKREKRPKRSSLQLHQWIGGPTRLNSLTHVLWMEAAEQRPSRSVSFFDFVFRFPISGSIANPDVGQIRLHFTCRSWEEALKYCWWGRKVWAYLCPSHDPKPKASFNRWWMSLTWPSTGRVSTFFVCPPKFCFWLCIE